MAAHSCGVMLSAPASSCWGLAPWTPTLSKELLYSSEVRPAGRCTMTPEQAM
jgi:hypothetical protein